MDLRELSITQAGATRHPWERARADAVEYILRARGRLRPNENILDFGCGDAYLASVLAERHPAVNVFAVDSAFNVTTRNQMRASLPDSVRLFESLQAFQVASADKASLVLLLDVLEHCEDDLAVLESVVHSGCVTEDAPFLITVPAYQGLFSKHDEFLGHQRRYNLPELCSVVRNAGLEIKASSYFFSTLLLPRGLQVVLEKLRIHRKKPKGLGDHRGISSVDSVIRNVLWMDFRVCENLARKGILLPGLSCFVWAAKKPL